ncbi:MAG: hypothetical protein ACYCUI_15750 [Vulcanimicrobiaceae bacterium]
MFYGAIQQLNPENIYDGAPKLQQQFRNILAKSPNFFDIYVRIVFSVSGFSTQVKDLVKYYNQKYGKKQPIILISADPLKGTELNRVLTKGVKIKKEERESNKISFEDFCVPAFNKVTSTGHS